MSEVLVPLLATVAYLAIGAAWAAWGWGRWLSPKKVEATQQALKDHSDYVTPQVMARILTGVILVAWPGLVAFVLIVLMPRKMKERAAAK